MKMYTFLDDKGETICEAYGNNHDEAIAQTDNMCESYFAGNHKVEIDYSTDFYSEEL